MEENVQRELYAKIYCIIVRSKFVSHVGGHPKMSLRKLSKTGSVFQHLVNYPILLPAK